jgi:hypothetical protein
LIVLLYLTVLLLPGTVAVWLASVSRHRFLYAFAISLALFVFSQLPCRVGGGSLQVWLFVYSGLVIATWIACALIGRRSTAGYRLIPQGLIATVTRGRLSIACGTWVACLVVWIAAYWVIGPYTEVPSDIWNHLVRIGWEIGRINASELPSYANRFPAIALLNREYIHSLHAGIWSISGATPTTFLWESQLAVTLVFISAVFWFFHGQMLDHWSGHRRALTAGIATVLTTVWMGTGDWAFIRYYAIAPIIFSVPLFFLGVLIFVDYLREEESKPAVLVLSLSLILMLQALIHIQEAGLLLIFLFLISIFARLQIHFDQASPWPKHCHHQIRVISQILVMTVVVATPLLMIMIEPKSQHPGVILKPDTELLFLRDLWIVNPARQVWSTVTIGGILSLLLLITHWRDIRLFPYAVAGAALPFATVFNPIFIHLWERFLHDTLLWRFTLFLPAGLLVALAVGSLAERRAMQLRLPRLAAPAIALLFLLPLPYSFPPLIVNRAFSFAPLQEHQTEAWLADLVQFLETQPRQVIFTDPVTSYVLRGLTSHILHGNKFYAHTSGFDFRETDSEDPQVLFRNGLVVLNFRDGADSRTTKALNHWDKKELTVTRFYPRGLQGQLQDRDFELIWSNRDVFVYSHPAS